MTFHRRRRRHHYSCTHARTYRTQPVSLHGSFHRDSAIGVGLVLGTREFLRHQMQTKIRGLRFTVQVRETEGSRLLC